MGIAIIKNIVDDPSKEFIEIEDSNFVYQFKDVEKESFCRVVADVVNRRVSQSNIYKKGRLFSLYNPSSKYKEKYFVYGIEEGMNLILVSTAEGRYDYVLQTTDEIANSSIESAMLKLGYPKSSRVYLSEDFDGDVSKIEIEKQPGRRYSALKNIIIRRNNKIVISCKSMGDFYSNYAKEYPWYASEDAKLIDVLRLAKETNCLHSFKMVKEKEDKEPVYEYTNDIS